MNKLFLMAMMLIVTHFQIILGEYPEQPIQVIVPFSAPGGGAGSTINALVPLLTKELGVPVSALFIGGDQTAAAYNRMSKSKPDGYTLGLVSATIVSRKEQGLNAVGIGDLTPIVQINADPVVFLIRKDLGITNFKDFIEYVKKNPGKLKGGSGVEIGISYLCYAGVMVAMDLHPETAINWVKSKDIDRAIQDLKAGQIDFISPTLGEGVPLIKSGDALPILLIATKRDEEYSNIPTFKELTGNDFSLSIWRGIVAPKGFPEDLRKKLETAFSKVCNSPEGIQALKKVNVKPDFLNTKDFEQHIKKTEANVSELLKKIKK